MLPEVPEDYPVNYILDGQQRLTTLYGVFHSDAHTADPDLADRFCICYVPEDDAFVHHLAAAGQRKIFLRDVLDTAKLISQLVNFTQPEQAKIAAVTERFKDYEFPVVTIRDRTNSEVCSIFQRINSSGTPLSNLELLTAWTWSDKFDLRREIEALLDKLSDKGYDQIDQSLLMRCLAAVVAESIDSERLVDIPSGDLVSGMTALKKAIFLTVDFLEGQLSIRNIVFLPFPLMLVPLVYFYSKAPKPTSDQIIRLKKWFWHCAFTSRYKAGTNRMVIADIYAMGQLAKKENVFSFDGVEITGDLFEKTWRINSSAAKAAICLMAQNNPVTFLTGSKIDLGSVLAAYNAREFHHIYPKAFLAKQGVAFHEANVVANICFLSASDNNVISDSSPEEYFGTIPEGHRDAVFSAAFIPESAWNGELPYKEFLAMRVSCLGEAASRLIQQGRL